jgi:hypothetical protein
MALEPSFGPGSFFQFLNPMHHQKGSLDIGSARRKAVTYTKDNTNTEEGQTSVPPVGFEPMFPVFQRERTLSP